MAQGRGPTFKIKHSSGRVLGPLDLDRVRKLILNGEIQGDEAAREYPDGEWKDIGQIPALRELILKNVEGKLTESATKTSGMAATQILPGTEAAMPLTPLPEEQKPPEKPKGKRPVLLDKAKTGQSIHVPDDEEKTVVAPPRGAASGPDGGDDDERTVVASPYEQRGASERDLSLVSNAMGIAASGGRNVAEERTVVLERGSAGGRGRGSQGRAGGAGSAPKNKVYLLIRNIVLVVAVVAAGLDLFFPDSPNKPFQKAEPIRPKLPVYVEGKVDPSRSQKLYTEAMTLYVADTVTGYKAAAKKLLDAASYDINNVKALAMLASCYLNLIDSSNKDENYFTVISRLIEMSRAKAVDLVETVIADVEFYLTVGKAEAAQNRIVEYTKTHQTFGPEMFFYLAETFFARGDATSAARYVSQIPDNKVYSPRIYYLRGQIAEKLGDSDTALAEYRKALKLNPDHARSHLRIAGILGRTGGIKASEPHIRFLIDHAQLLPPLEMARAYYLAAQLYELEQNWEVALAYLDRAVKLDKENHDYLLELYSLKGRAGEKSENLAKAARMYYFLSEGEKLVKEGKYQDALAQFLQAREANLDSTLPLMKIGDMFVNLRDVGNARINYQLAAEKAPNDIAIWSKYINILIQSYEWEDAQKAMSRFRQLPVSQSAIDKAAGDMYMKQGRYAEAQVFYRKAMARESIDPDVYISYAKSLMATRNYKDAPFFFALAQRFDPLNVDALVGIAQAIAASESIDRGISMLQDELQKGTASQAELLSAIGELQIQKGDWDAAQKSVDEAMAANPEYPYPFKLQAQIYMNRAQMASNKRQINDAFDKALAAYKSYSDRNNSDPSGYLERYRVFAAKLEYEKAVDELARVYALYPKYPNLHYYRGILYRQMGNLRAASDEFQLELKNNPNSVPTLIELGKVLVEQQDAANALTLFNKAMQLAPNAAEPKHYSAYANYLLKNYGGAVALYKAAIAIDSGNSLLYKRLGMAYRDMGDHQNARQAFRKYLEMEPDAEDRAEFQKYL